MKTERSPRNLIPLLAIASAAIAAPLHAARADSSPHSKSLSELAAHIDPAGDSSWRETVPRAYRTSFGTQFHPHCFEQFADAGVTRNGFYQRLETALSRAVEKVAVDCKRDYPELAMYLGEWISQMRRSVILCSSKTSSELGFNAMNYTSASRVRQGLASDREHFGIDLGSIRAPIWERKPLIVFPIDRIASMHDQPADPSVTQLLVHEGFHSTPANNREDHNLLAASPTAAQDSCGDNPVLDRVAVITSLCTGAPLETVGVPAYLALTQRTRQCGEDNGCAAVMKSAFRSKDLDKMGFFGALWHRVILRTKTGIPSKGLSEQQAAQVCKRIAAKATAPPSGARTVIAQQIQGNQWVIQETSDPTQSPKEVRDASESQL